MGLLKKVLKAIAQPAINNHKGKVGEYYCYSQFHIINY
jgi:hypothetical protein